MPDLAEPYFSEISKSFKKFTNQYQQILHLCPNYEVLPFLYPFPYDLTLFQKIIAYPLNQLSSGHIQPRLFNTLFYLNVLCIIRIIRIKPIIRNTFSAVKLH